MIRKIAEAVDAAVVKWRPGSSERIKDIAARAAVEALRDPPDEILLAVGEPYDGKIDRAQGIQVRRDAWNKMLDAILAEVQA